jgi:hypothetical protein
MSVNTFLSTLFVSLSQNVLSASWRHNPIKNSWGVTFSFRRVTF